MFPQTTFRPDPHLSYTQRVDQPHPRNCRTIAKLCRAFESFPTAKMYAKARLK